MDLSGGKAWENTYTVGIDALTMLTALSLEKTALFIPLHMQKLLVTLSRPRIMGDRILPLAKQQALVRDGQLKHFVTRLHGN